MGECGFRGGYAELIGFDEDTIYQITKLLSSMLCPNIAGQLLFESYVNPPIIGDPSFKLYSIEKDQILRSLSNRASMLYKSMQNIPNISINPVQGAMYAFPRIFLPENAVSASLNHSDPILRIPDVYYCMKLLEETGIVAVPGSGFGQVDGTWHFRTTILPHEDIFDEFLLRFRQFHIRFLQAHS
ncbi:Alanine aminotransferase 2 [Oopsacas minuta]|uniref:alanine transaminase n=1 Tax=Oopsacas minuta TaxID=111878 RepID=A0AAV7JJW9_9METZ|nr:Alanine aminotransferase 2 [Oopsacas minuta]